MSPKRARGPSRKRTNRREPLEVETLRVADYPHVETLLRGYLHQDMLAEHGSPLGAVEAFLADVAPEDVEAVAAEGERLLSAIAERPFDSIRAAFLEKFRSSWHPERLAEIVVVLTRLREARQERNG